MYGVVSQKGQSEVLGAVLVFALVLMGISLVLVGGGQGIASSSQAVSETQTQEGLVELAGEVDAISHGSSDLSSADLNLNLDGNQNGPRVKQSDGSLEVIVGGTTIYDGSLGAVVYTAGETSIAYQGGGVWRSTGDGATIISEPGISERGSSPGTFTFPIIQVTGSTTLGDRTTVSRKATNQLYPSKSVGTSETVSIRIESEFARAWGEYFVDSVGIAESAVSVSNGGTVVEVNYATSEEAFLHLTHYRVEISDS
jgi:hypothetical protein